MSKSAPTQPELLMAEIMAEQELVSLVRQACDESGLDRQEIARRIGIHKSGISKLLNAPRNMTIRMAAKVMRAAGYRLDVRLRRELAMPLALCPIRQATTTGGSANIVILEDWRPSLSGHPSSVPSVEVANGRLAGIANAAPGPSVAA